MLFSVIVIHKLNIETMLCLTECLPTIVYYNILFLIKQIYYYNAIGFL